MLGFSAIGETALAEVPGGLLGIALSGLMSVKGFGRSAVTGKTLVTAKLAAATKSSGAAVVKLALAGRAVSQAKASSNVAGKVALQGVVKAAAAAQGSFSFAGLVALIGRMTALATARSAPTGNVGLSGHFAGATKGAAKNIPGIVVPVVPGFIRNAPPVLVEVRQVPPTLTEVRQNGYTLQLIRALLPLLDK